MPDLLTTSISDQMKEEIKSSKTVAEDADDPNLQDQIPPFKDMDKAQLHNHINEFNNSIINISQIVSDLDLLQLNDNNTQT